MDAAGHGVAADEVARVREELATATAGATPLAELDPTVRDLTRVTPLLEQLAGAVARLLGTDMAAVWTTVPGEPLLVPSAWVGLPDDYLASLRVPFGTGSAGRAVVERRIVLVDDVETSPVYGEYRDRALAHGIRSVLSVPMLTLGGEPMGALTAYYRARVLPRAEDVELVELYARQAAEMVERARLHAEARSLAAHERRRTAQLRVLADAAVALSTAGSLDDLLAVLVRTAREVLGSSDAAARALRVGEPDRPTAPGQLSAPLLGRDGRTLGVVEVSPRLDAAPFTPEDSAVLVQLAQLASSAAERLEAYEAERAARQDAEHVAARLRLLSRASAVFAESFETDGIAAALVDLLVPALADLAVVHVPDEAGRLVLSAVQTADGHDREVVTEVLRHVEAAPPAWELSDEPPAFLRPEAWGPAARDADHFARVRAAVRGAGIAVPLTARGRRLGLLSLAREAPFVAQDVEHAVDLARQAGLALDNARRYAFERDLAVTLQRSLLPRELPMAPGFRAAARYLAGAQGTQVGGDWYDLLEVGDTLVLVVGDVVGRGVRAAAVMGQLQATVRAYALEGHGPADVLSRLDRVASTVPDLHFTTCLVARLAPSTGRLEVCSAGHLPPLVAEAGGGAHLLDVQPGRPLGVGGGTYEDEVFDLPPGAVLLLYTDGLVEERDAPLTDGLDRLVAALEVPVRSADEACAQVLRALGRDERTDDDTAVLALHRCGERMLEQRLPRLPQSAGVARRGVRRVAAAHGLDGEAVELLVSELVGNAVRYGAGSSADVVLRVTVEGSTLRVEVDDPSERLPDAAADPGPHSETGRGLLLVEALASGWGALPLPDGKRVWFEVDG